MSNTTKRADIERRSSRLKSALTVLLVALWVLLILERFGWMAVAIGRGGTGSNLVMRFLSEIVAAFPEALYILSLAWIRHALSSFAQGDFYATVISRMLSRVGLMLAAGAFLNVFVVPGLERFVGFGRGYWIAFDVSGMVLGAVGLSLAIMARVLDRAREMQAELDEMF